MAVNRSQSYLAVILVVLGISLMILKSYITTLLLAGVAAYLFYPIHKRLRKKTRSDISAGLMVVLLLAMIGVFAKFGLDFVLSETSRVYDLLSDGAISQISDRLPSSIGGLDINFQEILVNGLKNALEDLTSSITVIPKLAIKFFVFLVSFFYFLKDGDGLVRWTKENLPMSKLKTDQLFREIKQKADAIIHVQLIIAIIQGVLGGIGFWAFGLPYPLISGILMMMVALIPWLGPYLIYIPVGIIATLEGSYFSGIGILLYGGLFVSTIDNFLRPYLASKRAKVHMLVMLVGIIGGIELFGIAGILIGPILLAIATGMLQEVKLLIGLPDTKRRAR